MKYMYLTVLLMLFVGCGGNQTQQTTEQKEKPLSFTMVSIPKMITEPSERADYLAEHFWDNFDFSDTRYIDKPEVTEQAFSDYINILFYASPQIAFSSIKSMIKKSEANHAMFMHFADLYEKYLHDPNSPMRNEELYIPALEAIVSSTALSEVEKIRPAHLLELALRNRIGEKANDFIYTLSNGSKRKLYDLNAEFVILYFYNPDCGNCKEVSAQLQESPVISQLVKNNKIKILAIYPDEDLTAWKDHLNEIPASWINSYDAEVRIKSEEIYDLKAIPTLYLLNKEKKVILKDPTFEQLEAYSRTI